MTTMESPRPALRRFIVEFVVQAPPFTKAVAILSVTAIALCAPQALSPSFVALELPSRTAATFEFLGICAWAYGFGVGVRNRSIPFGPQFPPVDTLFAAGRESVVVVFVFGLLVRLRLSELLMTFFGMDFLLGLFLTIQITSSLFEAYAPIHERVRHFANPETLASTDPLLGMWFFPALSCMFTLWAWTFVPAYNAHTGDLARQVLARRSPRCA